MHQSFAHSSTDVGNLFFCEAFFQVDNDGIEGASIAEFDENLEERSRKEYVTLTVAEIMTNQRFAWFSSFGTAADWRKLSLFSN